MTTRRSFLQSTTAIAMAATVMPRRLLAADACPSIKLPELGRLAPTSSREIASSPFSVGFETLDRKGFDPNPTYKPLGKLGVKWARVQTGWCRCETVKGEYDFAWLDEVVDSLLAQGIQPWFNLGYGNKLYTPESHTPFAVGYVPIFTEEARAGWTTFVDAMATHFADRVTHWEIWNEPNIYPFWRQRKPVAADYVELVKLTAPQLRRRIPNATLIGIALSGAATQYVGECFDAGIADHVDVISYHPYSDNPVSGEGFAPRVRKMAEAHHAQLELWQGECGRWADADPRRPKVPWNEQRQAKWLVRRAVNDLRQGMQLTSYFHAVDLLCYNHGGTTLKARIGLLRGEDYSPRLSYYGYQTLCTLLAQNEHNTSLVPVCDDATNKKLKTASFVRNGRALYVWWSPVDLFKDFAPGKVTLRLPTPARATIDNPVLVDPLSQRVYRLSSKSADSKLIATDLPLLDYPLLLTDRSVVPLCG